MLCGSLKWNASYHGSIKSYESILVVLVAALSSRVCIVSFDDKKESELREERKKVEGEQFSASNWIYPQ
jgi:hypothetical protein